MKVTIAELKERIKTIDWDVEVDSLQDRTSLIDQGLDSLDMINLLFCLEKEFSVKIPDDDVDALKSLEDFVSYINKRV